VHLQWTLYHTFGYVYGKSTMLVWKAVGAGLMTVLPAMAYTLKASPQQRQCPAAASYLALCCSCLTWE
jgi:hypothetical protein